MNHVEITVRRCYSHDEPGWLSLRKMLWPSCPEATHLDEMRAWCANPERFAAFVAESPSGDTFGFAEASIRYDFVNGTETLPVGFLEGIYVSEDARQAGVARRLVAHVEDWVKSLGCTEMASDALLDNAASQAAHRALGFEETERVVFFRKPLD